MEHVCCARQPGLDTVLGYRILKQTWKTVEKALKLGSNRDVSSTDRHKRCLKMKLLWCSAGNQKWWQKFHLRRFLLFVSSRDPLQSPTYTYLSRRTECWIYRLITQALWYFNSTQKSPALPNWNHSQMFPLQKCFSVAQYQSSRMSGLIPMSQLVGLSGHSLTKAGRLGCCSSSAERRNASFKWIRTKFFP